MVSTNRIVSLQSVTAKTLCILEVLKSALGISTSKGKAGTVVLELIRFLLEGDASLV